MKDVIFFGIQGSGKGTQAKILLQEHSECSYFSSGDLFRALTGVDNAIGNYLKNRLERGELINDTVTNALFEAYFYTVLHDKKFMVLDGYPRSLPQLHDMMRLVEFHKRAIVAIHLVLPDDVAIERMKERGRNDDTDIAIQHRIDQFYETTMPMIDFFATKAEVVTVDAHRTIEEVAQEIRSIVS